MLEVLTLVKTVSRAGSLNLNISENSFQGWKYYLNISVNSFQGWKYYFNISENSFQGWKY